MGLEYRGSRVSDSQDIIRLLDARAAAEQVTDPSDADSIIESRVAGLASKSYVDSAFTNRATLADVDAAYADKAPKSDIGQSIFALNEDGEIPGSMLPTLTTRGAVWVPGGSISPKAPVGDGGWLNNHEMLASVYINGSSLMGGRPYHMLGFGQIEAKGNFVGSQPYIKIGTSSIGGTPIGEGYGIVSWMDYYHITVLPTTNTTTPWTGNRYMYLTCRSLTQSSDFTAHSPSWGILLVPAF